MNVFLRPLITFNALPNFMMKSLVNKVAKVKHLFAFPSQSVDPVQDTTLLVHFFGTRGKDVLKYEDFHRFVLYHYFFFVCHCFDIVHHSNFYFLITP